MPGNGVRRIAVVGGGFAGCVTALELLRGDHGSEYEVTMFERNPEPGTTLCGEGLSEATLEQFTAFDSRPFIAESFPGAMWSFPGGVRVLVNQTCFTMARETWIPAMVEALKDEGVKYVTGEKVTPARVKTLAQEYDLVIGADGPGSQVRRHVGGGHETMLGIQYRVDHAAYETDRLEFYTDKRWSPEYAWIFPRGDMLNVGLLADEGIGTDENWRRLDAFMKEMGVDGKVMKREAYPIGFFGTRVQRGNVVLVGDAAGLTNPVTKGGMAAVIHAAKILAECVKHGRVKEYERRIFNHPLTTPDFRRAVAVMHKWTNEDFARLARFAPPTMVVGDGDGAEAAAGAGTVDRVLARWGWEASSGRRKYAKPMLLSMLMNPGKMRDLNVLARAMGKSRKYSW